MTARVERIILDRAACEREECAWTGEPRWVHEDAMRDARNHEATHAIPQRSDPSDDAIPQGPR